MGLVVRLQGQEVVGGTSPLSLDTLWLIGMLVHHNGCFILTPTTKQLPERGEDEDDESDDKYGTESFLSSTTMPANFSN